MRVVSNAIKAKLEADAPLVAGAPGGIHIRRVPQLDRLPAVVLAKQSGRQSYTLSARAYRELVYLVKGIAETREGAEAADERADAVLTDGTLTLQGQTLMRMRRTGDVEYSETAKEGRVYWHIGGLYAVGVTPG